MAPAGHTSPQLPHFTQSPGVWATPRVPSASSNFAMAPVGQNVAHMRQETHFVPSMTTAPHRRVSSLPLAGSPSCANASSNRSRRSGIKCGSVPSFMTWREWAGRRRASASTDEPVRNSSASRTGGQAGSWAKWASRAASTAPVSTPSARTPTGGTSVTTISSSLPQAPST